MDTDALIASYLDEKQLKQVRTFATTLLERNKHMNLTGALTVDEVLTRHVADSLALIPAIESALGEAHASSGSDAEERSVRIKLLDVGSGAGFPGMALAIARPNWNVTLLDTLQKRTTFLADAADACGVSNVTTLWSRAEDAGSVGSEHREAYDLVTARAVAELRVLCELCVPMVKTGGAFLAAKTPPRARARSWRRRRRRWRSWGARRSEPRRCAPWGRTDVCEQRWSAARRRRRQRSTRGARGCPTNGRCDTYTRGAPGASSSCRRAGVYM